ncbi:ribosome biogenesis GTPase [Roseovarius marisflavi]|uniref:Small ribosomal subunit biogenesis GTPase RsgA n=1 Tax=Roseovarius marisflavi TaxID=1054996 RepID=A0A1M6V6F5_9RHOB|nr:ribosome small subunit-dependent GTPase A [Roseovarius marisflavi]SHK76994.1 ribosome biogenesis GTPase [Roseovarius marisflavi]
MTQISAPSSTSLAALGWSKTFEAQLTPEQTALAPMRIATVHRSRVTALSPSGTVKLNLPAHANTTDFAVGDWVLVDRETDTVTRRLERSSLLRRRTEGTRAPQLIAANIDTLFIVTSCNADFNPARLERYLAHANEAGTTPVILLTKADMVADAASYQSRAAALQRGLEVVTLNAKDTESAAALARWCGPGQTVALVGSSGVGKSTLLNTLAAKDDATAQPTSGIREDDAKGRHTTTSRSLHGVKGGGLAIDTPGMRSLHVSDIGVGLDKLFSEIAELAPECRFRDCTHAHEPGCAVQAAVAAGALDPDRLERWRKLSEENRVNTPVATGPRGNKIMKKGRTKR